MKKFNMKQGSEDWFSIRAGKPSASQFSNICTTKGEATKGATREKLINSLVAEFLSGQKTESYSSAAMERGVEKSIRHPTT